MLYPSALATSFVGGEPLGLSRLRRNAGAGSQCRHAFGETLALGHDGADRFELHEVDDTGPLLEWSKYGERVLMKGLTQ